MPDLPAKMILACAEGLLDCNCNPAALSFVFGQQGMVETRSQEAVSAGQLCPPLCQMGWVPSAKAQGYSPLSPRTLCTPALQSVIPSLSTHPL